MPERSPGDVVVVDLEHLPERHVVAAQHLPVAGDPRSQIEAMALPTLHLAVVSLAESGRGPTMLGTWRAWRRRRQRRSSSRPICVTRPFRGETIRSTSPSSLGHRDARFTFRVYQRAAKQRERLIGAHLAAFDRALEWAGMGMKTSHEPTPGQLKGELAALNSAVMSPS